jgi:hypothetical protein
MYYTPAIHKPEEGIDQILNAISKFDADRYLYALQYKHWDESKIELLSNNVETYITRLEYELNKLDKFAIVFNQQFATENNKCFSSSLTLLNKLKYSINGSKKIFKQFCPLAHQNNIRHKIANNPFSAFEYSRISSDTYQLSLFEFEGYPPCVNKLFNLMEKFFLIFTRSLQLCKQVLKDEQKIRNDKNQCYLLFLEYKDKILVDLSDILTMISPNSVELTEENCPAIRSRNRYESDEAWATEGFHNFTQTEVKYLIIKQVLDKEQGCDLTRTERLLFGDEETKVHKYRYIIQHFDELIPDSYNRKNLPAKYILMFFQYIGIKSGNMSVAVNYFNEKYFSSPTHKFEKVTYQAVNGYKKEVLKDKDGAYAEFVYNLKQHFYANSTLQNAANF